MRVFMASSWKKYFWQTAGGEFSSKDSGGKKKEKSLKKSPS